MPAGFFPAFDPRITVTYEGDGASIFHHVALLDVMAEEHGFPALSSFADDREPPPDFDGYPEDLADAIGPWTSWFSPADGLRCVEGLLSVLDDPRARALIPTENAVIEDLEALRDVLLVAEKKKVRFRLEVA